MLPILKMCPSCGSHGIFQISENRPSRDFVSKHGAYIELQELLEHSLITQDDLARLSGEVAALVTLPDSAPQHIPCELFDKSLSLLRKKERADSKKAARPEESPSIH